MKRCSGCGLHKPETEFTGNGGYCKPCHAIYQSAMREAHRRGQSVGEWRPWILQHLADVSEKSRDDRVFALALEIFVEEGVTGLKARFENAIAAVAKRNQAAFRKEGWIG